MLRNVLYVNFLRVQYNLSIHINDEPNSQMIAEGFTFVATETRVKYRRNSYHDRDQFFKDDQI
jgi:hypothetical protein